MSRLPTCVALAVIFGTATPWIRASAPALLAQEVLLDRTLAIVHGQVITLADVRGAVALGLVESGGADEVRIRSALRDATSPL